MTEQPKDKKPDAQLPEEKSKKEPFIPFANEEEKLKHMFETGQLKTADDIISKQGPEAQPFRINMSKDMKPEDTLMQYVIQNRMGLPIDNPLRKFIDELAISPDPLDKAAYKLVCKYAPEFEAYFGSKVSETQDMRAMAFSITMATAVMLGMLVPDEKHAWGLASVIGEIAATVCVGSGK